MGNRNFNIKISGNHPGPYSVYYGQVSFAYYARILPGLTLASNITLEQLLSPEGVDVQVPDVATSVILYNNNPSCGTLRSIQLTPVFPIEEIMLKLSSGFIGNMCNDETTQVYIQQGVSLSIGVALMNNNGSPLTGISYCAEGFGGATIYTVNPTTGIIIGTSGQTC